MKQHRIYRLVAAIFTVAVFGFASHPLQAADINKLIKECSDCHEKDGNTTHIDVPAIAGISTEYFVEAMNAYRNDARPAKKLKDKDETMKDVAMELSESDVEVLAEYFSKQKFMSYKQTFDASKIKAGKKLHNKYCEKCHTEGGSSAEDDAGILAGQPIGYLRYSMESYKNGTREMGKKMKKKFKKMLKKNGDSSIDQLIHFYASKQ